MTRQQIPNIRHGGGYHVGTWPIGSRPASTNELAGALISSAQWHSETAIRGFVSDDRNTLLQAAVSVGTASELLLKAVIAVECPPLLAARGDRASVLLLTGHPSARDKEPLDFKSITASEAFDICKDVARDTVPSVQARAFLPFTVRNAAAHMSLVNHSKLRVAIEEHCRLSFRILEHLSIAEEEFWGKSGLETAKSMAEESNNKIIVLVEAKISSHRESLNRRLAGLSPLERDRVMATLAAHGGSTSIYFAGRNSTQHDESVRCPACGQLATLSYEAERDDPEQDDDGEWFSNVIGYPVFFACAACALELESDQLDAVDGFGNEIPLDPDYEVDFEPDEDLLRER